MPTHKGSCCWLTGDGVCSAPCLGCKEGKGLLTKRWVSKVDAYACWNMGPGLGHVACAVVSLSPKDQGTMPPFRSNQRVLNCHRHATCLFEELPGKRWEHPKLGPQPGSAAGHRCSKPWTQARAGSAPREKTDSSHQRPRLKQTSGGKWPLRSTEQRWEYRITAEQEELGRGKQRHPRSEIGAALPASALW